MLLLHAFTERKCFEICFSLWVCARLKLDAVFSPVNYYFGKFIVIVLNLSPHYSPEHCLLEKSMSNNGNYFLMND